MIFVFGSNGAGRHGKGAAEYAVRYHGAKYGVAEGRQGNSYAIMTKNAALEPLSIDSIEGGFVRFLSYVNEHPQENFLLTPIGCGLAGHNKVDIMKMMSQHHIPDNVYLSNSWITN